MDFRAIKIIAALLLALGQVFCGCGLLMDEVKIGMEDGGRDGGLDTASDSDVDTDTSVDGGSDTDSGSDTGDAGPTGPIACNESNAALLCGAEENCVDGYCCDSRCNGECESCGLSGNEGFCTPIPKGEDPESECVQESVVTCGQSGDCDGEGGCAFFGTDTPCNDGEFCTSVDACDGDGSCAGGSEPSCDPGGGNQCCEGGCAEPTGCITTADACTETCGTNSLVTGFTCVGCGGGHAVGLCTGAAAHTCDEGNHTLCEEQICNGATYYCTNFGGTWEWRESDGRCDDEKWCTYNDICYNGSCISTSYTCESDVCAGRTCDGQGGCDVDAYDGVECGVENCPVDYCSGATWYNYPPTCASECDTTGSCETCSCSASEVTCSVGAGNECCAVSCSPSGCGTVPGTCPGSDTCTNHHLLSISQICQGCGADGAAGTCAPGSSYPCNDTDHDLCETVSCGGAVYYCTDKAGEWRWDTDKGCNDTDPCTFGDVCGGGVCSGSPVECTSDTCMTRSCNGSADCTETPKTGDSCGTTNCAGDYCGAGVFYDYPDTCTKKCSDKGDCDPCACTATQTTCSVGAGNQCCFASCDNTSGCKTNAGACADVCGQGTVLTVGRQCQNCGANNAVGTCSGGTQVECSASVHTPCQVQSCGGQAYNCTNADGSWKWRTSTLCDDGNACTVGEACLDGVCKGGSSTAVCPDGACTCGETTTTCPEDCKIVADCTGQPDFTLCNVVTSPDRSYDICINGTCQSPGCGTAACNAPGTHFPLADTNQRLCYNDTDTMTCTTFPCDTDGKPTYCGQDAQYGWDVTHEETERFSRSTAVSGQPIVTDKVTGLFWQACAFGQSGDMCATGSPSSSMWSTALADCDSLTWGGYNDWRLPDEYELMSIVDYNQYNPSGNENIFSLPQSGFRSSSLLASDLSQNLEVMFYYLVFYGDSGELVYLPKTSSSAIHFRCVRGTPNYKQTHFTRDTTIADYPTVIDNWTGLEWQGCMRGKTGNSCETGQGTTRTWSGALSYCEALSWAGHSDWRLPNVVELRSIVNNSVSSPAIDSTVFPATLGEFASSSTDVSTLSHFWIVGFANGTMNSNTKTSASFVRCVRGGP